MKRFLDKRENTQPTHDYTRMKDSVWLCFLSDILY